MNVTRSLRGRSEGEFVAGGTLSPGLDAHSLYGNGEAPGETGRFKGEHPSSFHCFFCL